jgi:LPS-assembly lipoprotein
MPGSRLPLPELAKPARRRWLAAAGVALVLLSGCGFQLRKPPEFAFKTLYTGVGDKSLIANELKRYMRAIGSVQVLTDATQRPGADVVLDILSEQREKVVVGLNAAGQVREFLLRTRLKFKLSTPQGKELIAPTEILQERDISFNETAVLSKETEETMLYRDMQSDIVQQLMRRLAAIKAI